MKIKKSILIILLSSASISVFADVDTTAVVTFTENILPQCGITADGTGRISFSGEDPKDGVNLNIIGNALTSLKLTIPEASIEDLFGNTDTVIDYSFEPITGAALSAVTGGSGPVEIKRGSYIIRAQVTNKEVGVFEANKVVKIQPTLELSCG